MKDGNTNGRKMTQLCTFRLHTSDLKVLKGVAKRKEVSVSNLIRSVLERAVNAEKKKAAR